MDDEMYVNKRNGKREIVSFDKISKRVRSLGKEHNININFTSLVMKIIEQLYDGINTTLIDELTAQQAASLSTTHPDYTKLASSLVISNLHKKTDSSFSNVMNKIYNFKDINGNHKPLLSDKFINIVNSNSEYFDNIIDFSRDYLIDYFGFKTLEKSYLFKIDGIIVDRPQFIWLRVAICIHENNLDKVKETYDLMSLKYFTHATPTLFNAGTPRPQLSSCYLIGMEDDSVDGIFNTLKECANISKWAGGIGLHIHNIRAKGSHIRGTNGIANGIVPMLKVFNNTARYIDQGGGRRNGSFAIYIEPHHADIEEFLEMKKNHGDEELRARDLFYGLWISDLFMERVKKNTKWSLFCPDSAPDLSEYYGDLYKEKYEEYEKANLFTKQINARDLWIKILDSQMETGTPYILYKDAANKKSNQNNLGTIKSSNLCCEIIEYSSPDETAVCNLASIALTNFVNETEANFSDNVIVYSKENCNWCLLLKVLLKNKNVAFEEIILTEDNYLNELSKFGVQTVPQLIDNGKLIGGYDIIEKMLKSKFDYDKLHEVTKVITENLNNVIDINFYPTEKTERSNLLHRPIGIGVQGLADVFLKMNLAFTSEEAKEINQKIFETIYNASLEKSMEISKERKEDMEYLIQEYNYGNWTFKDSENKVCREYNIYNNTTASSSNTKKNDTTLIQLLDKIKPIPNEIKNNELSYQGAYSSYIGSPMYSGKLQFDLWNKKQSDRYNWDILRENISLYGVRNSLLVAPMPTASTSQILGNNECFEPFTSNVYSRRTLAGEFVIVNKYLIQELIDLKMWNSDIKNNIIANRGSVQGLSDLPKLLKEKYKVVWEMSMKDLIDMAEERGKYICQSQSLNLFVEDPDSKILTNMHFYSWSKGLKTGIYYLRRKPKHQAQQFTVTPVIKKEDKEDKEDTECLMCSG